MYGQQTHKYERPYFLFTKEAILLPKRLVMSMLKIKQEPYQIMSVMTQAFKLDVNTHESNGLTMVIDEVLLEVKHNTIRDYKLHPVHPS